MSDQPVLYGSPHSQFTYKVALMLRLAGEPFSFRYTSFQKAMHRTQEFRAMSPWGEVPVLTHGGRTLVQSAAILEYLAATLGKFEGRTAEQRQHVREWLYWDAHRLTPPIHAMYGVHLAEQKLLPIAVEPAIADYHRRQSLGRQDDGVARLQDELRPAANGRHRYHRLITARRPRGSYIALSTTT
jgi:glutathione S-transferase